MDWWACGRTSLLRRLPSTSLGNLPFHSKAEQYFPCRRFWLWCWGGCLAVSDRTVVRPIRHAAYAIRRFLVRKPCHGRRRGPYKFIRQGSHRRCSRRGPSLIFRISSQVSFKDKVSYSEVSVFGDVFVRDQLKHLAKVASVYFRQDDCKGNPVVSYVQRHGTPQGLPTPLANGGYTLASSDATFNAPLTNEPYSKVSGDFNPIHVNPYFSDFASSSDILLTIYGQGQLLGALWKLLLPVVIPCF